ncbi:MAG: ABC transporter permease, partial [Armatimonadetes bacterium]|nr:ABC transporter permease [Armatimonadota bacterium]
MNGFFTVLLFELRLKFRQVSTYAFFAALFGLVFATMTSDASVSFGSGGAVKANSPYTIFIVGNIFTVLGGMILSATMGTAVYRDFEANAHELFFTTGVGKAGYFLGRFFGSYLVTAFVFLAVPLGILLATFAPWVAEGTFGAFRADAYLSFIGVFLLPNLLFVGALFFVWGAITRNLLAIYAQSVVLFVAWAVSITLITAFNNDTVGAIVDPFGITAAVRITRYWTVAEQNNNLIPLTGYVLGNRLFWLAIAAAVMGVGYQLFAFAKTGITWSRRTENRFAPQPLPMASRPLISAPEPAGAFRAFLRLTGFYLREIVTGIPFIVITVAGMILLITIASTSDEVYDTPIYPVTRVMADSIATGFSVFFIVLITFYSGELTWRERVLRVDQIADTTPVPTGAMMLSKIAAVITMLIVLNFVLMVTGMGIQTVKGYFHYEPGLYIAFLFGDIFPHVVALTFLAFFIHSLVNNKAVGHLCMILLYGVFIGLEALGFERQLYLFGSTPSVTYSDMNGFGPFVAPLVWWNLYWLAFAVLLLVAARKLWVRGTATSPLERWRKNGVGTVGAIIAGVAGLAWVGAGAFNTYNTDVLNDYDSGKDLLKLSAKYERDYKATWAKKPMPRITGVSLDVSLYPERRQYTVAGTYILKNKTAVPISEVALDFNNDYVVKKMEWGIPARAGITDTRIGFRTYTLSRPLQPGETTTLTFDLAYEKTGFPNDNLNTDIAANGTFLTMPAPHIGYRSESEIGDESERKKQGLPPRPRRAPVSDKAARQNPYISDDADWIDFEATVRTVPGQIALAPGYLQKEWTENGRRCFRYKMDAPILNFYT